MYLYVTYLLIHKLDCYEQGKAAFSQIWIVNKGQSLPGSTFIKTYYSRVDNMANHIQEKLNDVKTVLANSI